MKKLKAYFPIWFLLMLPPLIFVILGLNLITSLIGIGLVCFLTKNYKKFFKSAFRLWCVALSLDIITFLLLLMPELLNKSTFIKENLILPLETNPYKNIFSILYLVILVIPCILIISKKLISKIVVKKMTSSCEKTRLFTIILMLFIFPYLLFVPSNKIIKSEYTSLADYKGTIMANKTNVIKILKYLETYKYMSSYVLETNAEPYTINIYLKDTIVDYQLLFEKDASLIFYVVDDVNEVVFHYNNKKYIYTINSINLIYRDIKNLHLQDVSNRYENDRFKKYVYLGNIKGYDVFDTSEFCELENQYVFSYFDIRYYLNCTSLEEILLYKGKEKLTLKEAVEKNLLTPDDFMESILDVKAEGE